METSMNILRDEIDQLRWELGSGAYAGCSEESLDKLYGKLMELEDMLDEQEELIEKEREIDKIQKYYRITCLDDELKRLKRLYPKKALQTLSSLKQEHINAWVYDLNDEINELKKELET